MTKLLKESHYLLAHQLMIKVKRVMTQFKKLLVEEEVAQGYHELSDPC